MECTGCGKETAAGKKFCPHCGSPLGAPPAGPPPPPRKIPRQEKNSEPAAPGTSENPSSPPPPGKPAPKRFSSREIENFNPPKPEIKTKSAPVKKKFNLPATDARAAAAKAWAALAAPWKFVKPLDSRLPATAKSALSLALAVLLLAATVSVALRLRAPRPAAESPGGLPPGVRLLDETISDSEEGSRIEICLEAGNSVQEADLRKLLDNTLAAQRGRTGFKFNKHPTHVSVSAYASETIYRQDRAWWLGKLTWIDGVDKKTEVNMDALLPRNKALGFGGPTREEYLARTDAIFLEIHASMGGLKDLFRKYEKMIINENEFIQGGQDYSDSLYTSTREIPGPPWDDCRELAAAFEAMVSATGHFQNIFAPESEVFKSERFNSEVFYERLNEYTRLEGVYAAERKKYNIKK